jgi:hypothetical protein
VELVDTQASEACGCKAVLVRVQSSAPFRKTGHPVNRMPFLFPRTLWRDAHAKP